MRSTYSKDDVEILLKDITGQVTPQSTAEREKQIQAGRHYCEMLPIEYAPTEKYMEAYGEALKYNSDLVANAVGVLAAKIREQRGENVVLVSLARAGIPVGILLKRYLKWKYHMDVKHYSISIIRGRGIDKNAIWHITKRHPAKDILFVDGWTGKGAIFRELEKDVQEFENLSSQLAVLADPANLTDLCGTHEDILIPSSCLNCTVSGLISRTFLRDDIIGKDDFHGAVYYQEMEQDDLSHQFLNLIEDRFSLDIKEENHRTSGTGLEEVEKLAQFYGIDDINLIKPGIGETTRVLLRRVPWKILISEEWKKDPSLRHIMRLAEEKHVPIEYNEMNHYKACGLIKKMADA